MEMSPTPQPDFFSLQIAEAKRFHTAGPLPDNKSLSIMAGGREHCAIDYRVQRDSFPFWAVEFVIQGRGKLELDGQTFSLVPGFLFSYGPGTTLRITSDPASPLVKYFIDISGPDAPKVLSEHGLPTGAVAQSLAPGELIPLFDDLIRHGLLCSALSVRIMEATLSLLLLKILDTSVPPGNSGSLSSETYRRCLSFIENHWQEVNSLKEISSACHIDPAYLCRLFRQHHGLSPYQLLLRIKLNQATILLGEKGSTVQQIAEKLGFCDAFHFSRLFKKTFGVPPTEFRTSGGR